MKEHNAPSGNQTKPRGDPQSSHRNWPTLDEIFRTLPSLASMIEDRQVRARSLLKSECFGMNCRPSSTFAIF